MNDANDVNDAKDVNVVQMVNGELIWETFFSQLLYVARVVSFTCFATRGPARANK